MRILQNDSKIERSFNPFKKRMSVEEALQREIAPRFKMPNPNESYDYSSKV